jgi:hypothetical protein
MKSSTVWLLAAALTAGVLMIIAFNAGGEPDNRVPEIPATAPSQALPSASETTGKPGPSVPAALAPDFKLVPDNAPQEALLEAINDVAITYDPVELPKIKPYLLHPDPEVRKAALDGMVVLGDAAAAPLLRDAARQVASSKEAIEMMQAAEFLELPSATGLIKDGVAKPKGTPRKGPMRR